jgi:hypothetical protein
MLDGFDHLLLQATGCHDPGGYHMARPKQVAAHVGPTLFR